MSSFLQHEIHEQPQILEGLIEAEGDRIARIAGELRRRDYRYAVIAARGTSDNAATYGKYLFATMNRLAVGLATPSLFTLYHSPPDLSAALVIGISQSGQSTDIVEVVAEARRQGAPTLAITNDGDSPLADAAEHVILLHAGQERSVAATKTYTAQLTALAMLAVALSGDEAQWDTIRALPEAVASTLTLEDIVQEGVERYRFMAHCAVIGRGYNYATAFEIALKLKELAYVVAQPYSSADFLHGPIALVAEGFPVLVIAPRGGTYPHVHQLAHDLQASGAELIAISDAEEVLALAKRPLALPAAVPEWLSPVVCVVPGQLFACYLTLARGYDLDRPRGLHKVTVTR